MPKAFAQHSTIPRMFSRRESAPICCAEKMHSCNTRIYNIRFAGNTKHIVQRVRKYKLSNHFHVYVKFFNVKNIHGILLLKQRQIFGLNRHGQSSLVATVLWAMWCWENKLLHKKRSVNKQATSEDVVFIFRDRCTTKNKHRQQLWKKWYPDRNE